MSTKLEQAIAAIKSGDKTTGRRLLAEVLKTNWNNEDAWMWLAETDVTDEERYKCFRNALKINPTNAAARHGMDTLQSKPATQKGLLKSKSPPSKPPNNGTKKCPYCAETIKAEALVCRFCGRDLAESEQTEAPQKERRNLLTTILVLLVSLSLLCAFAMLVSPSSQRPTTGGGYKPALEKRLSYLSELPEVSWVEIENNNVYIGFNAIPDDLGTIVRAAAFHGNKAIDFGVHVWAVDTKYIGWRPAGDNPYICTATARYGKVQKSNCK